ncbi:MAG: septum site-determining protein MinC [Chloroflexi bacterium]|nr:septum site-determining protein MinC [Chloroflexota bacterium]
MTDAKIDIKGVRDGLLIIIDENSEWMSAVGELAEKLDKQAAFFAGAKLTINLGSRPVTRHGLSSLKAALDNRKLALSKIMSDSPTTTDAAESLDLRTGPASVAAESDDMGATQRYRTQPFDPNEDTVVGLLVPRTLRSGRSVRSDGHVVVLGDVNAGAEIIAAGDIVIWGVLRGTVHAGAIGDVTARVCALEMAPTQLRIADRYSIAPQDKGRWRRTKPEMARIEGDYIVVEPWQRTARKD